MLNTGFSRLNTKGCNMNILLVILGCIAVATGSPTIKTWTLGELSEALQTNDTDKQLRPALEDALNMIMLAIFTGEQEESIKALIRSPDGGSRWTQDELSDAMKDPSTKPAFRIFFRNAYQYLQNNKDQQSVEVVIPVLDISTWTLSDLKEAISNRATHPKLLTYLKKAQADLEKESGNQDVISIVTPFGLIKNDESNLLSRKW